MWPAQRTLTLLVPHPCHRAQRRGVARLLYLQHGHSRQLMNRQEEYARAKIGRVAVFCRQSGISPDLKQRVQARRLPRVERCLPPLPLLTPPVLGL
eukprot:scaffold975_cov63-Phaeocystis_antarctica.AAC.3